MKLIVSILLIALFHLFPLSAQAGVDFRSDVWSTVASSTSLNPGEPAGAAQNDILIYWFVVHGGSSAVSTPAGWTLLYDLPATSADVRVYWIRRGAGAAATTITWTGSGYAEANISAWTGAVTSGSPFDTNANNARTTSATVDCPAVTTTIENSAVIALGMNWTGWGSSPTPPSGYTLFEGAASRRLVGAYSLKGYPVYDNPAAFSAATGSDEKAEITLNMKADPIAIRDSYTEMGSYSDGPGSITLPTTATGDFLIIFLVVGSSVGITTPTGWTRTHYVTIPGANRLYVFWTRNTGTVDTDITWSGGTSDYSYVIASFTNVASTGNPMASMVGSGIALQNPPNPQPPYMRPGIYGTMAVVAGVTTLGWNGEGTPPAGYTLAGAPSGANIGVAIKQLTSSASESPGAFAGSNTGSGNWTGISIALRPQGVTSLTKLKRQVNTD
jgi:hypothetical protein